MRGVEMYSTFAAAAGFSSRMVCIRASIYVWKGGNGGGDAPWSLYGVEGRNIIQNSAYVLRVAESAIPNE